MAQRRLHGLQRVLGASPQPVVDGEAEYASILVALNAEEGFDAQAVATATRLAARRRHGIHVLVLVTVPYSLPMDARMRDAEGTAHTMLEQARVQGGRRVTGHVVRVRPGQAGRRIVEEAEAMEASAIVMGLPRRVAGASLFGKTLETVLAERPCRIIIEATPDSQRGIAHAHDRAEVAG